MKKRLSIFLITVALIVGMVGCAPAQYNLTISSTEGGEVTTPNEGTFTYDEGELVNLVATPDAGYRFIEWTGDVDDIADVEDATTTITMNGDYEINANFVAQYVLTIDSTDGGEVTAPGEGIFNYDEGTDVDLVAVADEGYQFDGWVGDVGTIADDKNPTTTITMNDNYYITANFAIYLYFRTDAHLILRGPATLPPEERNPCVYLGIWTNIVMDSVRVDLPDGRSIIVHNPCVYGVNRFSTCEPGMPIAGREYNFTALDAAGEPIPGVRDTDVWVGVEPPDPPTNVRAEVTKDGILVSWDESPIVSGSFEPAAKPQLGWYQLEINRIETGEVVYGANSISASPYLITQDKADFIAGKDHGLSLSEMEDGTYFLVAMALSIAPKGSLGKELEYNSHDIDQGIIFTIEDGEITIK